MNTESHIHVPTDNLYKFLAIFTAVLIPTLLAAAFGMIAIFCEGYELEELWSAVTTGDVLDGGIIVPPPPPAPMVDAADADSAPPPVVPYEMPIITDTEPDFGLLLFSWMMRGVIGAAVFLLATAMLGFLLWYTRLQRYRDRLIRVEALTSELTYKLLKAGKITPEVKAVARISDESKSAS